MEPRLIYQASEHLKYKVEWMYILESEWIYCGSVEDLKVETVREHIMFHFENLDYHVAINRTESFETNSKTVLTDIKKFIGTKNFLLWDVAFKKVIEFNHIGVFRKGVIS